jgi:hypothetical protein
MQIQNSKLIFFSSGNPALVGEFGLPDRHQRKPELPPREHISL